MHLTHDTICDIIPMTKLERLRTRIENNPCSVSFPELRRLLEASGFVFKPGKGTTHHRFVHRAAEYVLTVPYRRPYVLVFYVKQALKLIRRLEEAVNVDE